MSNAMDRFKLIAEVRKRPALWDINSEEHRSKRILQSAWNDVAVAMGSNANACSRTWKSLRGSNQAIVKKTELRIKEAKLKGSYNPNNDYGSDWIYAEHMKFMNDIKKPSVNVNKSDLEIDKFKLIAEIRKRPALWDVNSKEHRTKQIYQTAWKDVAVAMGSDVNECSRMWRSLRDRNQAIVKKTELRIKEAKLKGSYNPNKNYSSQWPYLEHLEFINGMKLGNSTINDNKSDDNDDNDDNDSNQVSKVHNMEPERDLEMSNAMDKFKLIAEVRKRPALWDIESEEYRSQSNHQKAWKDLAVTMGSDVNDCRRMWKNLRNINHSIVKRMELRIQKAKLKGSYNPNNDYSSEWPYFEHMKFMNNIKKPSPMQLGNSNAIDKFKLIDEMRTRPELWDNQSEEHRSCLSLPEVWKNLAVSMGSDVDTCQNNWINLCKTYRKSIRRLELRIKEAKQNGSYNPNNNYRNKSPYFKAMEFMMDNSTGCIKLRTSGDKLKLIAEVRNRPELWAFQSKEHRSGLSAAEVWKDVAVSMGSDVETCQRNWISLCTSYNRAVTRLELRIQDAKQKGSYNPNNDYSSRWPYFEHMEFMKDNTNNSIKLRTSGKNLKLIAEVRNRPELWDFQSEEHRSCLSAAEVWKDVAVSMGSDVDTCQRNWVHLCRLYKRSVTRLELRIQEAKQKGSYNPNNDYSSQWPYFEHMEFMKGNTTNSIKLCNSGDKFKLIAEVRKRPELWCIKRKEDMPRSALQKIWEDLAQAMGAEVDDCKRQWISLVTGYRVEVKKIELRMNEDKLNGSYTPTKEYRSNSMFYERMKFCDDIKSPSLMELGNTSVNENNSDDNDSNQVSEFQYMDNNKMEPELDLEPEVYLPDDEVNYPQTSVGVKSNFSGLHLPENQHLADDKPTTSNWKCTKRSYDQANYLEYLEKEEHNLIKSAKVEPGLDLDPKVYISDDEDYDTDSQMSGMEFLSEPNSPQNQDSADDEPSSTGGNCTKRSYDQANLLEDIEKEEHNLTKSAKMEPELHLEPEVYIPDDENDDTDSQMSDMEFLSEQNSPQNQESTDDKPSSTGGNCTKRSYDQANLLEDLEKDEHNLIKSLRSNEMVPVTDSDYNFLVSFLPKMKKINELQNLQFRAKITDLMLDIARTE